MSEVLVQYEQGPLFYMLKPHFLFVNFTIVSYLKSIKVLIFRVLLKIYLRNSLIICIFAKE